MLSKAAKLTSNFNYLSNSLLINSAFRQINRFQFSNAEQNINFKKHTNSNNKFFKQINRQYKPQVQKFPLLMKINYPFSTIETNVELSSNKIKDINSYPIKQELILSDSRNLYSIKECCKYLNQFDSIMLEKICQIVTDNLRNVDKISQSEKQQIQNQNTIQNLIKQQLQTSYDLSINEIKTLPKMSLLSFNCIKKIYLFLDKPKIGFLRGDIHQQSIFKLQKFIQKYQKNPSNPTQQDIQALTKVQLQTQDFKDFMNLITDFQMFRLPKKGIPNQSLETKNNIYHRQLMLQTVSNEQAFHKFSSTVESLAQANKLHMMGVTRRHVVQWLPSVLNAVKDEQMKCKGKNLDDKKKLYGPYLIKLNSQKVTTLILTELISQMMQILFVGNEQQSATVNDFYELNYKKLCRKICYLLNGQLTFQKQQVKFKSIQKIYDFVMNYESKNVTNDVHNTQTSVQELADITKQQISLKDLEKYLKGIRLFQSNEQQSDSQEGKNQIIARKLDVKKILQSKLQYRYVKPEDRKQYLLELVNRLTRRQSFGKKKKLQIPEDVQVELATMLVGIMKNFIKVKNKYGYNVPLLIEQKKYVRENGQIRAIPILKLNEHFANTIMPKIQKQGNLFLHQQKSVPTIIPPLPWIEPEVGGYYLQATNFMRYDNCRLQQRLVKYADLKRMYNILNYLSSMPWKVNLRVLKTLEDIWTQGGGVGQVPERYSELISSYIQKLKTQRDPSKLSALKKKIQYLRDQYSQKCSFLFKLSTARAFSNVKQFYFPHNIDFRGRVYPIPPYFNHMGNDLSRGILLMGRGVKLGESGLKWLQIHCANLMGKDKGTIPQKLQFIQENLTLIKAIAADPLKNRQWLANQDCWQCLGAIFQLAQAFQAQNPQQFISYLHIHQDGSCNGLQHYAALGRDMQGAYQVNLGVTERPGDVYTHVAKMVIAMIQQDITGPQSDIKELAMKLSENIKRKTIKQTVMTSVYGVTFIGARQQINRQLKDQNFLTEDQAYKASIYVTKLTLKAISNLFSGAHHIKKWLIQCARLVSQTDNPMGWITPLGLPIIQPYRSLNRSDTVSTINQVLRIPKEADDMPINKMKQKSAFPPNFVHSLDSTHMLYTAQQCNQRDISFAAVHDSYWTHAGKVEEMNEILRDQFIKLHSEPLLQSLKISLEKRFPQIEFPLIPQKGEFDLENVRNSIFFFS